MKRKFLSSWKQQILFCKYIHKVKTSMVSKLTTTQKAKHINLSFKTERRYVYFSIHTGHEFHNHKMPRLALLRGKAEVVFQKQGGNQTEQ